MLAGFPFMTLSQDVSRGSFPKGGPPVAVTERCGSGLAESNSFPISSLVIFILRGVC